jgi:hypothetical protein
MDIAIAHSCAHVLLLIVLTSPFRRRDSANATPPGNGLRYSPSVELKRARHSTGGFDAHPQDFLEGQHQAALDARVDVRHVHPAHTPSAASARIEKKARGAK